MSYLKFDRSLMINLEESLTREMLRTNRKGAYHFTTIVDCNTRKYHGLLVMPIPGLDDNNHVLLSSLDETVIQHGAEFNLGLHKYGGNVYSPNGHKYIREYSMEVIPRTLYRVGGVILSKEKIFSKKDNRILIKYTLEDAHSPTVLRFRPFLAFRNVNILSKENGDVNKNYELIPNGIKTSMYAGYPDLHMQFNKKVNFVFDPHWYKGIEYYKEQERGDAYSEDLYVPGYFELPIKKGESIVFSASDKPIAPTIMKRTYEAGKESRIPRSNFYNCLRNAVEQCYIRKEDNQSYLIAGYPWFKVRARDLFISMPGATLSVNNEERYYELLHTALPAIQAYVKDGTLDSVIKEIEQPDTLLWFIWCIQALSFRKGMEFVREKYGDIITEVMEYLLANKHPNLKIMENGLLYAEGRDKPITWMNSMINGHPVVPRTGYIVEFNALWYNSLCFYREMFEKPSRQVTKLIEKIDKTFPAVFVNRHGYLFDYVYGGEQDWSVRPNMVLAIAMEYSPLTKAQKRVVLDVATRELLTPKGLRTLSPKSEGYRPMACGPQHERTLSYHQGTAWPWLLGPYLFSYMNILGKSGFSFVERTLISMEEEMSLNCVGTISELYDGNPPFSGRGASSYLLSIASLLEVLALLDKLNAE